MASMMSAARSLSGRIPGLAERGLCAFLLGLIWIYRHSFSLLLGRSCRFLPTCSEYADEALRIHGLSRGLKLTVHRVCRCHPWGGHGFDPVPHDDMK